MFTALCESLQLRADNDRLKLLIHEMQSENERLNLELFWLHYRPERLYIAMQDANALLVRCKCLKCTDSGRNDRESHAQACSFAPWFEQLLAECELTSGGTHSHLVCEASHWVHFSYGKRLTSATSINSPELAKLKRLFALLNK